MRFQASWDLLLARLLPQPLRVQRLQAWTVITCMLGSRSWGGAEGKKRLELGGGGVRLRLGQRDSILSSR